MARSIFRLWRRRSAAALKGFADQAEHFYELGYRGLIKRYGKHASFNPDRIDPFVECASQQPAGTRRKAVSLVMRLLRVPADHL